MIFNSLFQNAHWLFIYIYMYYEMFVLLICKILWTYLGFYKNVWTIHHLTPDHSLHKRCLSFDLKINRSITFDSMKAGRCINMNVFSIHLNRFLFETLWYKSYWNVKAFIFFWSSDKKSVKHWMTYFTDYICTWIFVLESLCIKSSTFLSFFSYYDIIPILISTSIMKCPIGTRSTLWVRPVSGECSLLPGTWSHLYLYISVHVGVIRNIFHLSYTFV